MIRCRAKQGKRVLMRLQMCAVSTYPALMNPHAVILFSGGLDSTTLLAMAEAHGFVPIALTFRYGQTHAVEVEWARAVAETRGVRHLVLDLPLSDIGGSSLLGCGEIPVETPTADPTGTNPTIPSTYVPARNLIFLSIASGVAEANGCRDLFIGANALDYSGYPDCRPAFLHAFERTVNLGTREGVESLEKDGSTWLRLHTPLVNLRKFEIIQRGLELGVDYRLTVSCYQPDDAGRACGRCESCGLRRRGFEAAGVDDPTRYQK